jgi:excisionase family DNA binding protein
MPQHVTPITPQTVQQSTWEFYVDETIAAKFLSVEPITIVRWARAGRIPAHPLGGGPRRKWRFLLSELDEWMKSEVDSPRRPRRPNGETIQ